MNRTSRRIVAGVALVTATIVTSLIAPVSAIGSAREGRIISKARSGLCPPPATTISMGDERDAICATALTADRVVRGLGEAAGARFKERSVETRRGDEVGGRISVSAADPRKGSDSYVVADGDGDVTVAYFPEGSLVQNYPGVAGYDPTLPTGLLVGGTPAVGDSVRAPGSSGLSQIGSQCFGLTTDPGGDLNNSSHASYQACYRWYKPTRGDSSSTYFWRQAWVTGSGHGGNFTHPLRQTRNHTWLNNSGIYDDYKPTDTTPVNDDCTTKTVTMGVQGAGFTGSLSESFTICPNQFGVQHLDLLGSPPKYQFGWDGDKGCGGGNCNWIGNAGGFQGKWLETKKFSFHRSIGLKWGIIAEDL